MKASNCRTGLDYAQLPGLSNEARHKLQSSRPRSIGQAARLDGITPAALTLLVAHLKRRRHGSQDRPRGLAHSPDFPVVGSDAQCCRAQEGQHPSSLAVDAAVAGNDPRLTSHRSGSCFRPRARVGAHACFT